MCCAAAKLAASGAHLEFIWDEGGMIIAEGMPPFTHLPVALVATAEKFYQVGPSSGSVCSA
jgi:hypothetical protein